MANDRALICAATYMIHDTYNTFQDRALPVQLQCTTRAVLYSTRCSDSSLYSLLDSCGLAACSDPPVVPSGPLGVSPDPPLCPPVLVVSLCPPVLLVSLLIPPRVLRCPWCLLDPTVA